MAEPQDRLNSLQRRGEKRFATSDGKSLRVGIDQTKCMGSESCVIVAPQVFALDVTQLGLFRRGSEPLAMKEVVAGSVDSETVIIAAKSCPYRAIYVEDIEIGDMLAGDPPVET